MIVAGGKEEGGLGYDIGSDAPARAERLLRLYPRHQKTGDVVKDQWQIQMQTRIYEKTELNKIHFLTHGIASAIAPFWE